ncbi:MAG: transcriptional regulator [Verrucomicrobia bacterium]|nr:transcriptional regulator [Verrucomicrobiota bacterium]
MTSTSLHHQLDRVIHEKGRLAIVSMLAAARELSFTEIREALGMTDGNLITHLKTLQYAGFLVVSKTFSNHRPLTTCSLTGDGRKAFEQYLDHMEALVRQHRKAQP